MSNDKIENFINSIIKFRNIINEIEISGVYDYTIQLFLLTSLVTFGTSVLSLPNIRENINNES